MLDFILDILVGLIFPKFPRRDSTWKAEGRVTSFQGRGSVTIPFEVIWSNEGSRRRQKVEVYVDPKSRDLEAGKWEKLKLGEFETFLSDGHVENEDSGRVTISSPDFSLKVRMRSTDLSILREWMATS